MTNDKNFSTNKNFNLEECGMCSGWNFNVVCDKSLKLVVIQISKCQDEENYEVTATSLEEDCDISKRDFPTKKDELIHFLTQNFSRIDEGDSCQIFHKEHPICPECYQDTLTSYEEIKLNKN